MRLLSYMGQWKSAAKEVLDRTAIVAKFLCLLHVTNNYLCSPTLVGNPINTSSIFLFPIFFFLGLGLLSCGVQVYGPSMLPTLNLTGDVVLAEHVSHRIGKVGRGDLVLVRSPVDPRGFWLNELWGWKVTPCVSTWTPCTVKPLWYDIINFPILLYLFQPFNFFLLYVQK